MPSSAVRHLLPNTLLELARAATAAQFVEVLDAPLLLVRVDDAASELARGLVERVASGNGASIPATMAFETVSAAATDLSGRVASARAARAPFTAEEVQARLRTLHVAVPLRKRLSASSKPFTDRVSVGRARNNDVVLRHESVSKFHAWFRRDDEATYYVGDAASRNGTRVNGELLASGAPVPLRGGDALRFGSVDAVLCPALVLWEALR